MHGERDGCPPHNTMPELDKNRVIDQHKALVFDGDIRYDLILGADFLAKSGIGIKYSSGTVE